MAFDIVIKGGTIFDGSGASRYAADVAAQGGRIKDIAPDISERGATKVIRADGKFVAPGFVDITSHADKNWSLFENPHQDYLLTQGVTTILAGNCGTSLAPLPSKEAVAALQKWVTAAGTNINWLTVGELLEELARHPLGVNAATLMGHGTIRRGILKGQSRALSPEELAQFGEIIQAG
ncbi:MAG: D-aminoacylase, partial [Patescibacteria group bacterium]